MRTFLLACLLFALADTVALAGDDAWVGTWKLDPSRSDYTGETFTYTKSRNGTFHVSDGNLVNDDFRIDGKDYKSAYGRTVAWTAAGDNAWDSITKANGVILIRTHRQLSADGNTLTITANGTKPDGSSFDEVAVFNRITGKKSLVGKWRATKVEISALPVLRVSTPLPGILRWEVPADKQVTEGKADGTPNAVTGPNVPKGLTVSYRHESPTEMSYVFRLNGKTDFYGISTLAPDGRSFSDVTWPPGKKDEKKTEVYFRQ